MTMRVDEHRSGASMTRREFMVGAAGLTFGVLLPGCARIGTGESSGAMLAATSGNAPAFNPWVSIATDGSIFIQSPAVEMGQGSLTSLPLIIAEELDADWAKVRIVPAPPNDALYGNPGFGGQMYTAGSNAVRSYFTPLRTFGAQVRRVLLDNAARRWGLPVAELSTEPSVVVHAKSGRRLSYGEIAAFAEIPAKAPEVKPEELKKPSEFRLIGHDVMRVDLPGKVNGTAQYSIDVHVPGMLYGAILRSPVEGGAPAQVDDSAARAVPGVERIIRLPFGVGVVAETPWAAFAAKDALKVTWDRKARGWGFDSDQAMARYAAAARDIPTVKVRLHETLLGGGFGRRGHRDEEFVVDSVVLSKEVRRPVKLM